MAARSVQCGGRLLRQWSSASAGRVARSFFVAGNAPASALRQSHGQTLLQPGMGATSRALSSRPNCLAHFVSHDVEQSEVSSNDTKYTLKDSQKREIGALAARIGVESSDLFEQALIHRLDSDKSETSSTSNHRMAVLGHSILQQVVTEYVYAKYPNYPAVAMRDLMTHFISNDTVARVGQSAGVQHAVVDGEQKKGEDMASSIVASAVKAIIAASFVENGNLASRNLSRDLFQPVLVGADVMEILQFQRPKLLLSHLLSEAGKAAPVTRLMQESGRATHMPTFHFGVFSGDDNVPLGQGSGWSLKKAENEALTDALGSHFAAELKEGVLPFDIEDFRLEHQIELMDKATSSEE